MYSLGTFIFQTPPLALLSSSLCEPESTITDQMASNMETHTRLNAKCNPTIAVFFLLSSDGSYTSVANWKHWVCCCKLSKSSAPATIRREVTGCFINREKHRAGILITDKSSKVFCHGSIQADYGGPLPWL